MSQVEHLRKLIALGGDIGVRASALLLKYSVDEARGPDGKWESEDTRKALSTIPPAQQTVCRELSKSLVAEGKAEEPKNSALMQGAVKAAGARLEGLQHATKSYDSLTRKLATKVEKGATAKEAAASIRDVSRYTVVASPATYADTVRAVVGRLEAQGYKFEGRFWKNTWEPGQSYRGLNATMYSPSGRPIEVQFHTEESLVVKNANHEDYEEQRLPTTTPAEFSRLEDAMQARALSLTSPPGA